MPPTSAVVVVGIDLERQTVILSDPGTPGGNLEEVSMELFMNSWADSGNSMIVCDIPPGEAADADPGGADDSAAVAAAGPLGRGRTGSPLQRAWHWVICRPHRRMCPTCCPAMPPRRALWKRSRAGQLPIRGFCWP